MNLRVIGGRMKGRRLASPRGKETRPSSGRMRNAVMNILGTAGVEGASVLDLYAGTGASGIEALSRGARRALFVEQARPALEALERNIRDLGLGKEEARVLRLDAPRAVGRGMLLEGAPFNLVFCDPPYEVFRDTRLEKELREALGVLAGRDALAPGAMVVVEHPAGRGFLRPPAGLSEVDRRAYSAAGVTFYRRGEGPPSADHDRSEEE